MLFTPEVLVASPRESKSLEHLIKSLGFTSQSESLGTAVLTHLRSNTPDLIILNAQLSEISGTSIAYRVKKVKRLTQVPIILLVDASNSKLRAEAELSGVDRIVLTPFQLNHMRGIISNLLKPKPEVQKPEVQKPEVQKLNVKANLISNT